MCPWSFRAVKLRAKPATAVTGRRIESKQYTVIGHCVFNRYSTVLVYNLRLNCGCGVGVQDQVKSPVQDPANLVLGVCLCTLICAAGMGRDLKWPAHVHVDPHAHVQPTQASDPSQLAGI
jgi:hypothetical protein